MIIDNIRNASPETHTIWFPQKAFLLHFLTQNTKFIRKVLTLSTLPFSIQPKSSPHLTPIESSYLFSWFSSPHSWVKTVSNLSRCLDYVGSVNSYIVYLDLGYLEDIIISLKWPTDPTTPTTPFENNWKDRPKGLSKNASLWTFNVLPTTMSLKAEAATKSQLRKGTTSKTKLGKSLISVKTKMLPSPEMWREWQKQKKASSGFFKMLT